jgi:anthranilate phosphoribosyltransferase
VSVVTADPAAALRHVLRGLAAGRAAEPDEVTAAFDVVMRGDATPAQVAGLLMGLRVQGETPDVVAAVARSLRAAMVPLAADRPDELVDTCGTGGGTVATFNISTAAALVAAGAGARWPSTGTARSPHARGAPTCSQALACRSTGPCPVLRPRRGRGSCSCSRRSMHPAMRHVGPGARELAVPTVMNVVGPSPTRAMRGGRCGRRGAHRACPLIAGALAALGSAHALVVHGEPGARRDLAARPDARARGAPRRRDRDAVDDRPATYGFGECARRRSPAAAPRRTPP